MCLDLLDEHKLNVCPIIFIYVVALEVVLYRIILGKIYVYTVDN